ncbi:MAG: mannose-1-phosphate guanylyltransferase/mannose-6-phosphate isomerase [Gammaproteobacteria bacterium]|nr:mannose-1-phosphate guanylyltransferase/mannose-6-phosphate isomerase [Gammaproteobacteria bacterium]
MLIPVILCGGSGSRLWPLSRAKYPKQILALDGNASFLQSTVTRAQAVSEVAPVVVSNEEHRFLVAEQVRALGVTPRVILEPAGRNTAPAVMLAALLAEAPDDAVLLILPADHAIADLEAFASAVRVGERAAREGRLVTFGIVPDRPHTGYGYIRAAAGEGDGARPVEQFVEKPDAVRAAEFLADGGYFWNSGMFMFQVGTLRAEMAAHAPDIAAACEQAAAGAAGDLDFIRPDGEAFLACRSESIDYALMEHTTRAVMVPLASGWSDVGSWAALHELLPKDERGNALVGDALAVDCDNCLLYSSDRLVSAVGLSGQAVIETKDAVMVVPLARSEEVKSLVGTLEQSGRDERELHREVFRPWGSYDSIDAGERFQVKRLVVKPGAQLSLQLHNHRAEHWVVVQGVARITRGTDLFDLYPNQSTYIPLGVRHRIENPGKVPLHLIEVQSGDYLGEDDIVRFEDVYGREGTRG